MQVSDLNLCLCPFEISWNNKEKNLANLGEVLDRVHPNTDLLILPETFSTGFPVTTDKEEVRRLAERNTGQTIDYIKELCKYYKLAMAGSFIADSGGSLYNRAFFIEPSGDEVFADKHHLFAMGGEDKVFSRGYDRLKIRYRGWNLAMIICYDIRFPVWCRNVNNEYDALIAVANWPDVRVNTWNTLAAARAMENSAYVCAVNCKGTDPKGYKYDGSSAVYDFKGKDISVKAPESDLLYATLCRSKLDKYREKFPVWHDADPFKLL